VNYYEVVVGSQRYHGSSALTYSSDDKLELGQLVAVPLRTNTTVAYVEKLTTKPNYNVKPITRTWPLKLPANSIKLLDWLRNYYPGTSGVITSLFLPPSLPNKLDVIEDSGFTTPNTVDLPSLTPDQEKAMSTLAKSANSSVLLHGDTGSGKTRVYIEQAAKVISTGNSVLLLTPEIGLTAPLVEQFQAVFGEAVNLTHSQLTPAQRRQIWLKIAQAKNPVIAIGPRSALFLPFKKLSLIIMDEAHDYAYKQEQTPYYQTSRVAAQLASIHKAQFIMGTATPSVVDYFTFKSKGLPVIRMKSLATAQKQALPKLDYKLVDLRQRDNFTKSAWLSNDLIRSIEDSLANHEQTLLFLNRRGSARLVMCQQCGWQSKCPRCDVALTYHNDSYKMICHTCGFSANVPTACPVCSSPDLLFKAIGTKSLEEITHKLFPTAKIARFDSDTLEPDKLRHHFAALSQGQIDIIVGTQTIVKGFDLPNLAVVGVIQADSGLQIPDYSAAERSYQLISQVSGRVGRGHRPGKLFLQTYNPDNTQLKLAIDKKYEEFYDQELAERQKFGFPPFVYLLKISSARASRNSAQTAIQKLADSITSKKVRIWGPSPKYVEKANGKYRWQIVIRSTSRSELIDIARSLPGNTQYDIDPTDLL